LRSQLVEVFKPLYLIGICRLSIVDQPKNIELDKVPSTPEGLNDSFATEFTRKIRKVRERVLGERPQLR
jgi:hypothetical protein